MHKNANIVYLLKITYALSCVGVVAGILIILNAALKIDKLLNVKLCVLGGRKHSFSSTPRIEIFCSDNYFSHMLIGTLLLSWGLWYIFRYHFQREFYDYEKERIEYEKLPKVRWINNFIRRIF
jgi:hypothetical protein